MTTGSGVSESKEVLDTTPDLGTDPCHMQPQRRMADSCLGRKRPHSKEHLCVSWRTPLLMRGGAGTAHLAATQPVWPSLPGGWRRTDGSRRSGPSGVLSREESGPHGLVHVQKLSADTPVVRVLL